MGKEGLEAKMLRNFIKEAEEWVKKEENDIPKGVFWAIQYGLKEMEEKIDLLEDAVEADQRLNGTHIFDKYPILEDILENEQLQAYNYNFINILYDFDNDTGYIIDLTFKKSAIYGEEEPKFQITNIENHKDVYLIAKELKKVFKLTQSSSCVKDGYWFNYSSGKWHPHNLNMK